MFHFKNSPFQSAENRRKVSPILATLTSRSDSDFDRSNAASKKINLMALIRTVMISTTRFERMKEKFNDFRQTALLRILRLIKQWYLFYSPEVEGSSFLINAFAYSLFVDIYSVIPSMTGYSHSRHLMKLFHCGASERDLLSDIMVL